jgi:DNA/RNA endonuclease G (NUC1)
MFFCIFIIFSSVNILFNNLLLIFFSVNKALISIVCAGKNLFHVEGFYKPVPLDCVTCAQRIIPDIAMSSKRYKCDGELKSVGFNIAQHDHVSLYESCINMATKQVHWVEHTLNGHAIDGKAPSTQTTWTKTGFNDQDGRNLDDAYKINSQERNGHIDIYGRNFIYAKGHLFPNADGIFRTHRAATYTYFNAVPQWQSINNGNWKLIENNIRTYASAASSFVKIRTGGYGDKLIAGRLNLSPTGPPIPKWIYKIVHISENEYYVFNIFNSITLKMTNDHWCRGYNNICALDNEKWYLKDHANFEKGQVYCCKIHGKDEL